MNTEHDPGNTPEGDNALTAAKALGYAHLGDVERLGKKTREEEWARRHSMPTKLLGWMLIAGFVFEVCSGIIGGGLDLGGILFLFAGIAVMKGSQNWLRFVTVLVVLGALFSIGMIIHSFVTGHPIAIGKKWFDFRELEFWTLGVSPVMFLIAESILSIVAIKLRRIEFWTRSVKVWTGILGGFVVFCFAVQLFRILRDREFRRDFSSELEAARNHLVAHGGWSSLASRESSEAVFSRLPRVMTFTWRHDPKVGRVIYRKFKGSTPTIDGKGNTYSEWIKLSSGEWGKIELKIILPESP